MDHARIPNDDDWTRMLDELEDHVAFLRKHGPTVRARAKGERSPYRSRSMPDGGSGGSKSDPTADYVVRLAGGQDDDDRDNWRGGHDEVGNNARNMWREATDARNRLRGSTAAARRALPVTIPDVPREVCVSCGVPKHIAGRWVVAEGRCGSCSTRIKRNGKVACHG